MAQRIVDITMGEFNLTYKAAHTYTRSYEGFTVTTEGGVYYVGVSNSQNCCERWGAISTNDDVSAFIGAGLILVEVVDKELDVRQFDAKVGCLDSGGAMFVNFTTTVGVLQLVVYNAHNGYYGHDATLSYEEASTLTGICNRVI